MSRVKIMLLLLAVGASAAAQDLSTEITVDRTVLPQQRQAERPSFMPSIVMPLTTDADLSAAEYVLGGTVTDAIATLAPAPWRARITQDPYDGYAAVGYLPAFNLGARAGYRFVNEQNALVNGWVDYLGYKYSRQGYDFNNHHFRIGLNGAYWFNKNTRLSADIMYCYDKMLHPQHALLPVSEKPTQNQMWQSLMTPKYTQTSNRIDGNAKWEQQMDVLAYDFSLGFSTFAFGKGFGAFSSQTMSSATIIMPNDPLSQTSFRFGANVGSMARDLFHGVKYRLMNLGVNGCMQSNNDGGGHNNLYDVRLYANLVSGDFRAHIGARMPVLDSKAPTRLTPVNYGGTKINLAPDVEISYSPTNMPIGASLSIGGERVLNPLSQIMSYDPYVSPYIYYGSTYVPLKIDGNINLGRFYGFGLDVYGGWAKAIDALMPYVSAYGEYGGTVYMPEDMKCWHAGVRAEYAYKSLFSLSVKVETADSDHGAATWYTWYDRAKTIYDVAAAVHPVEALSVIVGFENRINRKGFSIISGDEEIGLGDAANLYLHGKYQISPEISVVCDLKNLTNSKHLLISGLPAQGIHGLLSICCKF